MSPAEATARPRVEGERETEIYDSVVRLLIEVGYDKLTLDAVAADVRASKATLYRKWNSKASLVVDAVVDRLCSAATVAVDTGTLRGDLAAKACAAGGLTSLMPNLIGSLVAALHRDTDLNEAFNERFLAPVMASGIEPFRRAQARGEIGPDADLRQLATILPAMCIHHAVIFGVTKDRAGVMDIIDSVVLPACAATVK